MTQNDPQLAASTIEEGEQRGNEEMAHDSELVPLVHGILEIKILKVDHLKSATCGIGNCLPKRLNKDCRNSSNSSHSSKSFLSRFPRVGGLSNPLVEVISTNANTNRKATVAKTQNRYNTLHPRYNERFTISICEELKKLSFRVSDVKLVRKTLDDESIAHKEKQKARDKHRKMKVAVKEFLGQFQLSSKDLFEQCSSRTGLRGVFPLGDRRTKSSKGLADIDRFASKWIRVRDESRIRYGKNGGYGLGWITLQIRFTPAAQSLVYLDSLNRQILKASRYQDGRAVRPFYFNGDKESLLKYPSNLPIEGCRYIVPETYFMPRFNEEFCLYLSAHQPGRSSVLPDIVLSSSGKSFKVRSCFTDVSRALRAAKELICINAWSLNVDLKLIRTGPGASVEPTVGELLRSKAEEGVLVFVLLNTPHAPTASELESMSKNDVARERNDCIQYFKGTKVHCIRVKREKVVLSARSTKRFQQDAALPASSDGSLSQHHSEMILVDSPPVASIRLQVKKKRNSEPKVKGLVCFMGGLNLCRGVYDDADKSIFHTAHGAHRDDMVRPLFLPQFAGREPRADVFLKVTNKAAVDALQSFFEMMIQHAGSFKIRSLLLVCMKRFRHSKMLRSLAHRIEDSIAEKQLGFLNTRILPSGVDLNLCKSSAPQLTEELLRREKRHQKRRLQGHETETSFDSESSEDEGLLTDDDSMENESTKVFTPSMVQLFRSGDADSFQMNDHMRYPSLSFENGLQVDTSLHKAVVHHLRVAQRFLYLETDSLIGSSQDWMYSSNKQGPGALRSIVDSEKNRLPSEIVAKICEKMQQRAEFHVYLTLSMIPHPVIPEGSNDVLDVIHHRLLLQRLTLEYMYRSLHDFAEKLNRSRASTQQKPASVDDYLSVYTLGKVEEVNTDSAGVSAGAGNRFHCLPIAVKSGILLVDDVSVLVAPESFTQATLDGRRDSVLGAAISDFSGMLGDQRASKTQEQEQQPLGYVAGFRQGLWGAHLGAGSMMHDFKVDKVLDPASGACVSYLKETTAASFEFYCTCNSNLDLAARVGSKYYLKHLMSYPLVYNVQEQRLACRRQGQLPGTGVVDLLGKESNTVRVQSPST